METIVDYWVVAVVAVFVFVLLFIKIAYPFWNIQPVLHTYSRWFHWPTSPPYIVYLFPRKTKYTLITQTQNNRLLPKVTSQRFDSLSNEDIDSVMNLYRSNYILSDRILFSIEKSMLKSYSVGKSLVSLYSFPVKTTGKDESGSLVGAMMSRGVRVFLGDQGFPAYFFDLMCVYRSLEPAKKTLVAHQLFQTHEWNQRCMDRDVHVSVFRKDGDLCRGVVPFVQFRSATFFLHNLKIAALPPDFQLKLVRPNNHIHLVYDFIDMLGNQNQNGMSCGIHIEKPAIYELVLSRQLFIGILTKGDQLFALYFLKNANTKYEELDNVHNGKTGGDTLHLVASFSNIQTTQNEDTRDIDTKQLFYNGFLHCIREILRDRPTTLHKDSSGQKTVRTQATNEQFGILMIDAIGHSIPLMEQWKTQHVAMVEIDAAYYLYNLVWLGAPVLPNEGFFLV